MNMRQVLVMLVIGIMLGAGGAVYLPGILLPYLPDALAGKREIVKGVVAAKEKKPSSLLLSVNTPQGALLATFTRKAEETDLLVGVGDSVEISIARYEPFVGDPKILRVVKNGSPSEQGAAPVTSASSTAQTGTHEGKTAAAGKTAPAAASRKGQRQ